MRHRFLLVYLVDASLYEYLLLGFRTSHTIKRRLTLEVKRKVLFGKSNGNMIELDLEPSLSIFFFKYEYLKIKLITCYLKLTISAKLILPRLNLEPNCPLAPSFVDCRSSQAIFQVMFAKSASNL